MLTLGVNGTIFLAEQVGIPLRKQLPEYVVTQAQLYMLAQGAYMRALDVAHMNVMPTYIAGNYAKITTRIAVKRSQPLRRTK